MKASASRARRALLKNSADNYGLLSKTLHWIIVLMMLALIWLGWYMVDLTYFDRWYNTALSSHRSLGLLIAMLAVVMLAWRLYSRPPRLAPGTPLWERIAAHTTHVLLYAVLVAAPLTGYFISTSSGSSISIFGWLDVPAAVAVGDNFRDLVIDAHYYLAYGSCALIGLHVIGALKHEFIDRDRTLRRML